MIRDELILKGRKDSKKSTSNYTFRYVKLVIKTIVRTKEMNERYRRALRFAKKSEWKNIYIENKKQIEKWCRIAEKMRKRREPKKFGKFAEYIFLSKRLYHLHTLNTTGRWGLGSDAR